MADMMQKEMMRLLEKMWREYMGIAYDTNDPLEYYQKDLKKYQAIHRLLENLIVPREFFPKWALVFLGAKDGNDVVKGIEDMIRELGHGIEKEA